MSLNYVSLTCDLFDGSGSPIGQGVAVFAPTVTLVDSADNQFIPPAPTFAALKVGASPVVKLLATDNSAPLPNGWGWSVSFVNVPGNPAPFTFFLPFSGGGSQNLSDQAPVSSAVAMQAYMPLPSGTPVSGKVPVSDGSPQGGSAWGSVAINPLTTLGDLPYGGVSGALTRLAGDTSNTRKFLRTLSSGGVAAAPVWDSITYADLPLTEPWQPSDDGYWGANSDPVSASGGGALTAQALYLARIVPRVNKTLTTISLAVSAAGSGSSTGTFVGVYGSAGGAPLSTSLDCAASFTGSTGWKPINLQVAQPLTAGNLYFVAVLCNLSVTQVTLLRQLNTAVNNAPQASADVTKLRWAQQLAFSTTTMGSVTLSSNTTTSNSIVVLLS